MNEKKNKLKSRQAQCENKIYKKIWKIFIGHTIYKQTTVHDVQCAQVIRYYFVV